MIWIGVGSRSRQFGRKIALELSAGKKLQSVGMKLLLSSEDAKRLVFEETE
jgi:hypothetical protein